MEIKIENVWTPNIKNLNLEIEDNKITAFIGTGNTYILELIGLITFPIKGQIKIGNNIIKNKNKIKDINNLSKQIGIQYKNSEKQFFMNTVKEELEFALNNYKIIEKEKRIKDSLKMVHLKSSLLSKNPLLLSQGEKKQLSLAIILAFNPNIILLNEPTKGLDSKAKNNLIKLIKMMKNRYKKTIIINTKDTDFLLSVADQIYLIDKGKIIKKSDKYTILSNHDILNKYNIKMPEILKFIYLAKTEKNIKLINRDDISDLMKDVYRNVK